jgi:hypothetical protein
VAGRYGQPQDIGERARVPVGHRAGQARDLRRQNGLGRDHPLQERQPARVLAGGLPAEQVPTGELAGEAHPHPAARAGGVSYPLGYQVVEGPVQVRERDVDRDPGDGQPFGGNRSRTRPP